MTRPDEVVHRRTLRWQAATVLAVHDETPTARTFRLKLPAPHPHLPGQHYVVRLTAPDGYSATRSYSVASASESSGEIELTVEKLVDGEVSEFLHDVVAPGDELEVRGPIGGFFAWRGDRPALLVGGGSGVVPLMAMIRARGAVRGRQPFRLIYSVRTPADVCYAEELRRRVRDDAGLDVHLLYTRKAPEDSPATPKRIDVATLNTHGWPPDFGASCFVCGPTGFVEAAADILVALGHEPRRIRTERFGGTS